MTPHVGLNLSTDTAFVSAVRPLFADGLVEALEWDVDSPWVMPDNPGELPPWIGRLLDLYADDGCLYGHSVWLSMLTASTSPRQQEWIRRLGHECRQRPYRHISEHHGFMAAGPFVVGPLLPLPYAATAIDVGRERLSKLAESTGAAVGLENLANALSPEDATLQPAFLDNMLASVDGGILLDLHNIYAQAQNLCIPASELLDGLASGRVYELHVSGGLWKNIDGKPFRFDGHNGPVPAEVFALIPQALLLCPNVEVVIFERRTNSLHDEADAKSLREDYCRVFEAVHSASRPDSANLNHNAKSPRSTMPVVPKNRFPDRADIAQYQNALIDILRRELPSNQQQARLCNHPAAESVVDYVASMNCRCVAAMSLLVRRWARSEADLAMTGVLPDNSVFKATAHT